MNIFVINLKKDIKKKRYIEQHFKHAGISDFHFISGVYGNDLKDNEIQSVYEENQAIKDNKRPLTRGEIGCALSHLNCYREILKRNEGAFIFEDDCKLNNDSLGIMRVIDSEFRASNQNVIILLSLARYIQKRSHFASLNNKHYQLKKVHKAAYAHAYYITPPAAKEMLNIFQMISRPIDTWNHIRRHSNITLLCVYPYCVSNNENAVQESSIAEDRNKYEYRKKSFLSSLVKRFRDKVMKVYLQKVVYLITGIKSQTHTW